MTMNFPSISITNTLIHTPITRPYEKIIHLNKKILTMLTCSMQKCNFGIIFHQGLKYTQANNADLFSSDVEF